jgi:hypothetical protein
MFQSGMVVALLAATALNPAVAPGGNFNLSVWQLQLPIGSPGKPTQIPAASLKGSSGYTSASYFYTDKSDGAMTFWAPENGVTFQGSSYARTELRETNSGGSLTDWTLAGNHTLSATLKVVSVTDHVCVGQVHLGAGGSSTKPLLELYYYSDGTIYLGAEKSPAGGQNRYTVGHVPVGTQWSYVINVTGNKINLTINGAKTAYAIPTSFNPYRQYFKAGDYNQSSSSSSTRGARVKFYALGVTHK